MQTVNFKNNLRIKQALVYHSMCKTKKLSQSNILHGMRKCRVSALKFIFLISYDSETLLSAIEIALMALSGERER